MTKLSIIIPVLNEEDFIENLLNSLKQFKEKLEIILVDGGSIDNTLQLIKKFEIKLLKTKAGRANQMNFGAKAAHGDFLLFIHADTILKDGFEKEIDFLLERKIDLASFRLGFTPSNAFLKFNSFFSRINHSWFYFGDQGLWVSRKLFFDTGGFDIRYSLLEDQELFIRLSRNVIPFKSKFKLYTSSRAYQKYGSFRLQFLYYRIWFLFKLGYSPKRLSAIKKKFELKYKS